MPKIEEKTKENKTLKAKKDPKDGRKNLKVELITDENKNDFLVKLGKKICGDNFQLPKVI
jgi:hypothetical protein